VYRRFYGRDFDAAAAAAAVADAVFSDAATPNKLISQHADHNGRCSFVYVRFTAHLNDDNVPRVRRLDIVFVVVGADVAATAIGCEVSRELRARRFASDVFAIAGFGGCSCRAYIMQ
jgi:hypothetical protein